MRKRKENLRVSRVFGLYEGTRKIGDFMTKHAAEAARREYILAIARAYEIEKEVTPEVCRQNLVNLFSETQIFEWFRIDSNRQVDGYGTPLNPSAKIDHEVRLEIIERIQNLLTVTYNAPVSIPLLESVGIVENGSCSDYPDRIIGVAFAHLIIELVMWAAKRGQLEQPSFSDDFKETLEYGATFLVLKAP